MKPKILILDTEDNIIEAYASFEDFKKGKQMSVKDYADWLTERK